MAANETVNVKRQRGKLAHTTSLDVQLSASDQIETIEKHAGIYCTTFDSVVLGDSLSTREGCIY